MAFTFKKWIIGLLPSSMMERDSYKDTNGEGLFVRYLENFGEEIDEEMYPYLKNFMDLFDTIKCKDKYLTHLSFILGLPPSVDDSFDTYRKVLSSAIAIYKVKGTKLSYQLLFNLVGLDIDIFEEIPGKATRYDDNFAYDRGFTYDQDCDHCSYYTIIYSNQENPLDPVPPDVLEKFQNIINFLEPINAKLRSILRRIYLVDEFPLVVGEDTIGFNVAEDGAFSDGFDTEFSFS